ncbi:hypothetical protein [Romboutsia lituseburensis]|uniref:hypothetical protein n=1 Tax=Romboutsia lituseburensis TaxID=1537 RepID=UPI00215A9467|nr:hypothetical protein [Romboutsia lituseburensis]MCR8743688.1 hypothetical protein [Romboutsia lituseburensis]
MEFNEDIAQKPLFKKNDEITLSFLELLYHFIDDYKFSLETVSILTKIELTKLEKFYYESGNLSYNELSLIKKVVILPFENVFEISKFNYKILKGE